jgi:hypothetical protein
MNIDGQEIQVAGRLLRIARLALDKFDSPGDPPRLLAALRQAAARIDLFTFMQKLPEASPRHAYAMEWDNLAVLPISTFEHWWTRQINDKTRNVVRLAEKKGIVVREVPFAETLVQGITAVYNESPVRQGKPFWHFGKHVDAVRRDNATFLERSIFIAAFFDDSVVGFAKLVRATDGDQAGLMQIIAMIRHRDKAPTNALIAHAVRSCSERGIARLLYGSFTYGRKQRDGLSDFKQHNGFRRVDLPRYYVPITPLGRAGLRLGLHHPLRSRVPEPLLAALRRARRRWYAHAAVRTAKG